ncbi:hypothetical protein WA1_03690 [Scytonema hofmannii PCC 7110]|uniref:Uncharacterized protein n=1 Tax=Scytonema hofmannii PCC 7110 TaxID=128403 RepID=A0A139X928_9CYAN|nr:hypothetical protein [Scytonema hofmannii]KYC41199.1 hypothetical protein WA1_03690 [Scytonema hofmannii PCC 7110]
MHPSPAKLDTPEKVINYCCEEILINMTWRGGGNGVVVICSDVIKNGAISGSIEGWQNVSFYMNCEHIQVYRPLLKRQSCYPTDVCEVFGFIENELLRTWKSSANGFANNSMKSSVSGRLTIRSECINNTGRVRVLVGETVRRRMFVETKFLAS